MQLKINTLQNLGDEKTLKESTVVYHKKTLSQRNKKPRIFEKKTSNFVFSLKVKKRSQFLVNA